MFYGIVVDVVKRCPAVNLVFSYLQTDVVGIESTYKLYRISGPTATAVTPFTLDTTANTIGANGVTTFFDWSGGNLTPTAASATLRGRIVNASGSPISRALVVLTDANGQTRTVVTNSFGRYELSGVPVGQGYVLNVIHKGYQFNPQVIDISQDLVVDVTAN